MQKSVLLTILLASFFFSIKSSGQIINYADSIIDFSSEFDPLDWSANQALFAPDVYPNYGDIPEAWAAESTGDREFLEFYFEDSIAIDSIYIYETYHCGAVDTVYIKNPNTGLWEVVFQGAATVIYSSRIFKVGFPMTTFPVSEIRIAINGIPSGEYVEIDAVAVVNSTSNTGLTELTLLNRILPYPNPSEGIVNLDIAGLTDVAINLFDGWGKLIYSKLNINDTSHQFELNNTPGIYFVQVVSQGEQVQFKLINK